MIPGEDHADPIVRMLVRQVHNLRQEVRRQDKLLETIATPPWKRVWFFVQGYRLWSLGRWRKRRWQWEQ